MINTFISEIIDNIQSNNITEIKSDTMNYIDTNIEYFEQLTQKLSDETEQLGEISSEITINYAIYHEIIQTYKKLKSIYYINKYLKIQESYFNSNNNEQKTLHIGDNESYDNFKSLVTEYFEDIHVSNIFSDPPIDYYVKVHALRDCGVIMCDNEFIEITKNKFYYLKKKDVLHLIMNGSLEKCN